MKFFFIIILLAQVEWVSHDYKTELWVEFKPNSIDLKVEDEFINALKMYKKVFNRYYMFISYSPSIELNEQRQRELFLLSYDYDSTMYKNMVYNYDLMCNKDSFKIEFKLINR